MRHFRVAKQQGAGVLELLVGMFISLLVLLGAMSSISFYQSSKRTAVSGNSALSNAISGLYLIGNDLRLAGLGLSVKNSLACTAVNIYYNGSVRSNSGLMAPVSITDSTGSNTDQITVMYGDAIYSGAPARLLASQASPTDSLRINLSAGSQMGNLALLALPGSTDPCTLVGVTSVDNSGAESIVAHASGGSLYNPASPTASFSNAPSYSNEAFLLNVGDFRWLTWRINNNILEVVNNITGTVEQIADNIVQMQAEYGVTDGTNPGISQWVSATGGWQTLNANLIPRIRAIRIALVARSTKRERDVDSGGACSTTTTAPASWAGSPAMDLSADTNWRCYRYRVLRMVYPIKNIVWGI